MIGTGGAGSLSSGSGGNIVLTTLDGLGLSPLGSYGGPTPTIALLPGSPALEAGEAVTGVSTDQRGLPLDSPVDIGAYQAQAGLVVNTSEDGFNSPLGDFSLRAAVNLANVWTGPTTIVFDPTVFATAQTIFLTAGLLDLSNTSGAETVDGPAAGVKISAGYQSRVFEIDNGVSATISGVTITGGNAGGYHGGYGSYGDLGNYGGGIFVDGTLTLTGCTVTGNYAAGVGGGLANYGTANLTDSTIAVNLAEGNGGGVYNSGTLTLTDCTVSGNSAADYGGGLYNNYDGQASLISCTISGNSGSKGAGGLYNGSSPTKGYNGKATLADTMIAGNTNAVVQAISAVAATWGATITWSAPAAREDSKTGSTGPSS